VERSRPRLRTSLGRNSRVGYVFRFALNGI
jgi:hypothetical protein